MGLKDKKEIVESAMNEGLSQRRVCQITRFNRSGLRYMHKGRKEFDIQVEKETLNLARNHQTYGYKRIPELLRRLGFHVNKKRIETIWKKFNLALPRRRKRKKTKMPYTRPHTATKVNDVWCYDFLFVRTIHGEMLKIFAVLDEFSRECLAIKVDRKINADKVMNVLKTIISDRGKPNHFRSDNGPEFIASKLRDWAKEIGVQNQFIEPGSPWQNGFIESWNGKFRDECLSRESFWSRTETQTVCNWYRELYNYLRPHSALKYKTPKAFAEENGLKDIMKPIDLNRKLVMIN